MKKTLLLFAVSAALVMTSFVPRANANGGFTIWHQTTDNNGKMIMVDQAGCLSHTTSHADDFVVSGPYGSSCLPFAISTAN